MGLSLIDVIIVLAASGLSFILSYAFFMKRAGQRMNKFLINALVNEQDQYIVFLDFDSKVILANKSFEDLVGVSSSDMIGKRLTELPIQQDIVEAFVKNNSRIKEGKSATLTYNPSFKRNNDTQWLQVQKRSLVLKNPNITYILVIASDISDKKLVEEKLSITQNEYKQLVESAQDIISRSDLSGNFRYVNSIVNQILGYSEVEFQSMNISDIVIDEDFKRVLDFYESQLQRRIDNGYIEFRIQTKDGDVKWLGQTVSLVKEHGRIVGFQAVSRDISVYKEAEKQLKRAKELAEEASNTKSGFISSMSHEFRTPLNAILGYSQILERNESLNATEHEHIKAIKTGGEQLLSMINDILELSNLDTDGYEIENEPIELEALMNEFATRYRSKALSKGLTFEYTPPELYPQVIEVDHDKFSSILKNILDNAIKFTNAGNISLSFRLTRQTDVDPEVENHLEVIVKDTGVGIQDQMKEQVYKPFWQEDGVKSQGTGLGLTLCKQMAQFLGGDVYISSSYGVGTEVKLSIPVFIPSSQKEFLGNSVSKFSEGLHIPSRIKVLIVDDLEPNRTITHIILKENGFDYREAEDGAEALSIMESYSPDIILMDINMPVMNGIEATLQIRSKDWEHKNVPIIAVTAGGINAKKTDLMDQGFSAYVQKPFKEEELISAIQKQVSLNEDLSLQVGITSQQVSDFILRLNKKHRDIIEDALVMQDFNLLSDLPTKLDLNGDSNHPGIRKLVSAAKSFDYLFITKVLKGLKGSSKVRA